MNLFDLLFIGAFLVRVVMFAFFFVTLLRGDRRRAAATLGKWATGCAVYLVVLVTVSFSSRRTVVTAGAVRCFDDWSIAVESAEMTPVPGNAEMKRCIVQLRLSSRARRVSQRENGLAVHLVDAHGTRYSPVFDTQATPFNVLLVPGESAIAVRTFEIPAVAQGTALIVRHVGFTPAPLIIGDDESLFHKRTTMELPLSRFDPRKKNP